MYTREELRNLKREFWNGFAEYCNTIPRLATKKVKFMLYNTHLKGTEMKFEVDRNIVGVVLEFNSTDIDRRIELFDHFKSCRMIFEETFDDEVVYEPFYVLESGKEVSRIFVEHKGDFDFHRREDWKEYYSFMARNMMRMERVFKMAKDAIVK